MTNSSNNVQEYIDYAPFLPPLLSTVRSIEYAAKSGIADGNYAASAVEYLESLRAVFPQRPLLGDMMSEQKDECQKYTNNQNESVAEDNGDCHNTRFGDTKGKIKIDYLTCSSSCFLIPSAVVSQPKLSMMVIDTKCKKLMTKTITDQ